MGYLTNDRTEKFVLASFEEAVERGTRNVYTSFFEVIEHSVVKAFFLRCVEELLDDKANNLAKSYDVREAFAHRVEK